MLEEVKFLHRLNNECDSIVGMKGLFYIESNVGIVLEYMDRGSLEFLSKPKIELDHDQLAAITVQILWGLAYLHHPHVSRIHRDIKPANVLINSQGEVKLSDFGISKFLELDSTFSAKGSFRYMSPERLNGKEYNFSSDVWSVGILIIQLWTKVYPFYYCSNSPVGKPLILLFSSLLFYLAAIATTMIVILNSYSFLPLSIHAFHTSILLPSVLPLFHYTLSYPYSSFL